MVAWLGGFPQPGDYKYGIAYECKQFIMEGKRYMARSKKDESRFVEFDFKSITWANIPMMDEDYEDFDALDIENDWLVEILVKLVEQGWKITASQQDNGKSYRWTAICLDKESPSLNLGTSSFSDDALEALSLLVYKIAIKADGDLSPYPTGSSRRRRG